MDELDFKSPTNAEIQKVLAEAHVKRAEYFRASLKSAVASAKSLFQLEDDGPVYKGV